MAPKKQQAETEAPNTNTTTIEASIQTILKDLSDIKTKLSKVDTLEEKLDKLQKALDETTAENNNLREENKKLKKNIDAQQNLIQANMISADSVERHQRSWSVRIQGVPLTIGEERDMGLTMQKVHALVFEPILKGAVSAGAIRAVPDFDQLLESAHVLPGKAGSAKPIIARFRTRFWKTLCFKHRKDHATRATGDPRRGRTSAGPGGRDVTTGQGTSQGEARYCFPFCDDLTKPAFNKLLEIQADPSVQSCWSINGCLRFKLKSSPSVRKVKSVFDPLKDILK